MTTMSPSVRVDEEFAHLAPPLRADEYTQLRDRLLEEGCRDALVAWAEPGHDVPVLLDGHQRRKICEAAVIPFRLEILPLADRQAARIWVRKTALARRNLTDDQRAAMALAIEHEVAAVHRHERAVAANAARFGHSSPPKMPMKMRARMQAAAAASVSHNKLIMARQIEDCDPALLAEVEQGRVSLLTAHRQVRKSPAWPKHRPLKSGAVWMATRAIALLDTIRPDDPRRDEAFLMIETWLMKHVDMKQAGSGPAVMANAIGTERFRL